MVVWKVPLINFSLLVSCNRPLLFLSPHPNKSQTSMAGLLFSVSKQESKSPQNQRDDPFSTVVSHDSLFPEDRRLIELLRGFSGSDPQSLALSGSVVTHPDPWDEVGPRRPINFRGPFPMGFPAQGPFVGQLPYGVPANFEPGRSIVAPLPIDPGFPYTNNVHRIHENNLPPPRYRIPVVFPEPRIPFGVLPTTVGPGPGPMGLLGPRLPGPYVGPQVRPIIQGRMVRLPSGDSEWSSSVTLIQDDANILVDTGFATDAQEVLRGLAHYGLRPEDIDVVVLTHAHPDHTGNLNLFPRRPLLFDVYEHLGHRFATTPLKHAPARKITANTELWRTPGHSTQDVTMIIRNVPGNGTVAVVGDLIPHEEFLINQYSYPLDMIWNRNLLLENLNTVICIADVIVPGHGSMFYVRHEYKDRANCAALMRTRGLGSWVGEQGMSNGPFNPFAKAKNADAPVPVADKSSAAAVV